MTLRFEKKFICHQHSLAELKSWIKLHSFHFRQPYPNRIINNLYFDDIDFNCYNDSHAGLSERKKYRLRWYGKFLELPEKYTFEIKSRSAALGDKVGYNLAAPKNIFQLSKTELRQIIIKSIPQNLQIELANLNPQVFTTYQRQYFAAPNGIRVTLDHNIAYYTCSNNKIQASSKTAVSNIVIEVKFNQNCANEGQSFTSSAPFNLIRNSKYTDAIDHFHFF